jgi:tetratricopeptide (TPR) repeat protein
MVVPAPEPIQAEMPPSQGSLQGEYVLLMGRLAGMTQREAGQIIQQHGGTIVGGRAPRISMAVVGDDVANERQLVEKLYPHLGAAIDTGQILLLCETQLWRRTGMVDQQHNVRRLYTPAMLAQLLSVPVRAIRRWHRQGAILTCCSVRRLAYFDFSEVSIARHLADLFHAGCSLQTIDRKLDQLSRSMPEVERPLADPRVVVEGRQLFIRRGDDLSEPSGQRQLNFDQAQDEANEVAKDPPESIPLASHPGLVSSPSSPMSALERLRREALQWEDQGELQRASETYRTMLAASGPSAEINFALADVLYRQRDLSAARERYYMAIEIDEDYVEARANLGCVLAETDDVEMAIAAFQGALAYHPDYADVHYHLASALDQTNRPEEARFHWRTFLKLAPESPWAETARTRLAEALIETDQPPSPPSPSSHA